MEDYEWKVMQFYANKLLEKDWDARVRYRRWSMRRYRLWRASYYKNNKIPTEDLLQRGVPRNENFFISKHSET